MKRETNWYLTFLIFCLTFSTLGLLLLDAQKTKDIKELENTITLQNKKIKGCGAISCNLTKKPHKMLSRALVEAVIAVESSGNPKAYNKHSGAVGLMQLTEIVYKKICGLTKAQAFEPKRNVACGTLFLNHLLYRFNSIEKALVFYNNGHTVKNKKYYKKVIEALSNNEQ